MGLSGVEADEAAGLRVHALLLHPPQVPVAQLAEVVVLELQRLLVGLQPPAGLAVQLHVEGGRPRLPAGSGGGSFAPRSPPGPRRLPRPRGAPRRPRRLPLAVGGRRLGFQLLRGGRAASAAAAVGVQAVGDAVGAGAEALRVGAGRPQLAQQRRAGQRRPRQVELCGRLAALVGRFGRGSLRGSGRRRKRSSRSRRRRRRRWGEEKEAAAARLRATAKA